MTDDADDGMFDEFADATEAKLMGFSEQIRAFRADFERMKDEQRNTPALMTPPPAIDIDALVTRVAELIVPRVLTLIPPPEKGDKGEPGENGKDAIVNTEEIVARIAEIAIPRISAAIPVPAKGDKGDPGERGEDGLSAVEEIRTAAREQTALQFAEFYRGVYQPDTEYRMGSATTWGGGLWIARRDTSTKPGTDETWQLAVKPGRDAKR